MNETSSTNTNDTTTPSRTRSHHRSLWRQSVARVLLGLAGLAKATVGAEEYISYFAGRRNNAITTLSNHLIKMYDESDESVEMTVEVVLGHVCEWEPFLAYDMGEDNGFIVFLRLADMPEEKIPRLYETGDLANAARLIISGVPVNEVMDHESLNRNQATDSPVE